MPCISGPSNRSARKPAVKKKTKSLTSIKIEMLESCLCAVLRELSRLEVLEQVLESPNIKGKVDIQGFWDDHQAKDEKRINDAIKDFDEDDFDILADILQKRNKNR